MSGNLSGLRKRLAKVEKAAAEKAERERLANCICKSEDTVRFALEPERFEAEMNQTCPVHGFRRLGRVARFVAVNPDLTECPNPELDRVLEEYHARESLYLKAKLEHDREER